MKFYEFNYLKKFNCIGAQCKHNCCKGWQIEVGKRALNFYKNQVLDSRFNPNCFDNSFFKLDQNLRCPFLDQDNLCYIIKNYGDKALCKTCKLHPRFKNFFTNRTETGLGLYCEQATKIILTKKSKMKLLLVKSDNKKDRLSKWEKRVLSFRNKCLSIIQNRHISIQKRLSILEQLSEIKLEKFSYKTWVEIFCQLEKLSVNDYSFSNLNSRKDFAPILSEFDLYFENILSYLAFRHISRAVDEFDLIVNLSLVILFFKFIHQIFAISDKQDLNSLIESCRFFSSEIECSDVNLFSLIHQLERLYNLYC